MRQEVDFPITAAADWDNWKHWLLKTRITLILAHNDLSTKVRTTIQNFIQTKQNLSPHIYISHLYRHSVNSRNLPLMDNRINIKTYYEYCFSHVCIQYIMCLFKCISTSLSPEEAPHRKLSGCEQQVTATGYDSLLSLLIWWYFNVSFCSYHCPSLVRNVLQEAQKVKGMHIQPKLGSGAGQNILLLFILIL